MCGGNVIPNSETATFGVCEACGSTNTLPRVDDEQLTGMFNRGNVLRMRGEYDKASDIYERVLEQEPGSAEAHWGIVLSRFGIEYVEDPTTKKRIPTCNRASFDPITRDEDFLAAVSFSDAYTAGLYQKEAENISDIQKNILEVSRNEKPYDIFICYKEKDNIGQRTKESLRAQDLYYNLTEAGYRVFFSRITLEDKLGSQYEPYIFSALNSAKVMLVVGSSNDNLNSVWVKNEWSRFLKLMKKDSSKMIIPCYVDMDPYDLPDELAILQSQDMGKIGFLQDLIRGIKKIFGTEATVNYSVGAHDQNNPERMNKTGETYLKLGEYDQALSAFERMTENCPEDYRGWWGLIRSHTQDLTVVYADQDQISHWYANLKVMADDTSYQDVKEQYQGYLRKTAAHQAQEEIDQARSDLSRLAQTVIQCDHDDDATRNELSQTEKQKKNTELQYRNQIADIEDENARVHKEQGRKSNWRMVEGAFIVIGLLIAFTGAPCFGISIAIIAGYLIYSSLQRRPNYQNIYDKHESSIRQIRTEMDRNAQRMTQMIEDKKRMIQALDQQKLDIDKQQDQLELKISKGIDYLARQIEQSLSEQI